MNLCLCFLNLCGCEYARSLARSRARALSRSLSHVHGCLVLKKKRWIFRATQEAQTCGAHETRTLIRRNWRCANSHLLFTPFFLDAFFLATTFFEKENAFFFNIRTSDSHYPQRTVYVFFLAQDINSLAHWLTLALSPKRDLVSVKRDLVSVKRDLVHTCSLSQKRPSKCPKFRWLGVSIFMCMFMCVCVCVCVVCV